MENICVYAASSNTLAPEFQDAAQQLGTLLAQRGHTLIYGAGSIGLMGILARAVHASGGRVVGVIPEKLRGVELAYEGADELIVTATMRERKAIMEDRADGFAVLPGGFGTLDEVMEVLVLRQLQYHHKPLVFLNVAGVFDPLFEFFHRLHEAKLVKQHLCDLYHKAATPEAALDYLESYVPPAPDPKWYVV